MTASIDLDGLDGLMRGRRPGGEEGLPPTRKLPLEELTMAVVPNKGGPDDGAEEDALPPTEVLSFEELAALAGVSQEPPALAPSPPPAGRDGQRRGARLGVALACVVVVVAGTWTRLRSDAPVPAVAEARPSVQAPAEAPPPPLPPPAPELVALQVELPLHFAFNAIEARPTGPDALDAALRELAACVGPITLVGHTCDAGAPAMNKWVGLQRAGFAKRVLKGRGLGAELRTTSATASAETSRTPSQSRRVTATCTAEAPGRSEP